MSRQKVKEDIAITRAFFDNPKSLIRGIRLEDDDLSFSFHAPTKILNFVLHLSEYPALTLYPEDGDPDHFKGTVLNALQTVNTRLCAQFNIPLTVSTTTPASPPSTSTTQVSTSTTPVSVQPPSENSARTSHGADSDDEESFDIARWDSNPEFASDVAQFIAHCSDKINIKPVPILECVDVEMNMKALDVIDWKTIQAWGGEPRLELFMKLSFHPEYYTDAPAPPKVEFFQPDGDAKPDFKMRTQLESIANNFVISNWKRFHSANRIRSPSAVGKPAKPAPVPPPLPAASPTKAPPNASPEIKQLMEMGFSYDAAEGALMIAQTVEAAITLLTEQATLTKESVPPSVKPGKTSIPTPAKSSIVVSSSLELQELGFLVCLFSYVRKRLRTLNQHCVICDREHLFSSIMLKPAVCSRDLCCWSFQQLGVARAAADHVSTGAEVIDLLVCMATAAAHSARADMIFDPFPLVFDPDNQKRKVLDPASKNFAYAKQLLAKFPTVETMVRCRDFTEIQDILQRADPFAFPLLQWIINSNQSHLVKLTSDQHIKGLGTTHQYLLVTDTPAKEAEFKKRKASGTSIFAFHGSPIENWHSIIRRGLKNASGSKLQLHGAAYGSGIYMSPDLSTSHGYCRAQYMASRPTGGSERFLGGTDVICIALCEVINRKINKSGTIWVVPDEDDVCTRFFFVYPAGTTPPALNSETKEFTEALKSVMSLYFSIS
ncbi:protein mono-ADP-ribosyltransferase PARP6 [Pelomyxa schiedti]|nr:protein mono-ADP-ribosyltransferase PARP6 [Pelomyxa schiedti]